MLETDVSPTVVDKTVYLKDYQAPNYLIPKIDLDFHLGATYTTVTSKLSVTQSSADTAALILNGEKQKLTSIKLNGVALTNAQFSLSDDSFVIEPEVLATHKEFELEIVTQVQPHLNTELSGLYQSSGNFCTQCEAEGFRRITYFLDRPDVLSVYTVKLTADSKACPVLLSNGNLLEQGVLEDNQHWAIWHDPHPKPCYLFALVAGDLEKISDQFVTASGQPVALNIYTQAHNIAKCDHAMASLKKSMRWDEDVYGREYDLDVFNIVAVDDFNMGAMENKGLNIFNSKYVLADQASATDTDFEGIESVIGHEYFHNWSGNRVTCRDWFQLSLKEGFTVFRDQEFSADMGSRAVKRIRDVQVLRNHQFKEDAGPMAHPVRPSSYQEINNFYTVTIYEKGAEVIRMMYQLVGSDGFRKASDLYFDKFDGCAVTTEDFVQCMEQANDIDLTQFRRWYTQSGTPLVTAKQSWDEQTQKLTLTLSQSCPPTPGQPSKDCFQIPVAMALVDQSGQISHEQTLELTESEQQWTFTDTSEDTVVSLMRDFSAPINLEFKQTDQELAHLVRYETNGFIRFESLQRMALDILLPSIREGSLADGIEISLLSSLKSLLSLRPDDLAILAEMLALPSEAFLVEALKQDVDPILVCKIRAELLQRLATQLEPELAQTVRDYPVAENFELTSEVMAQRALRNRALFWLCAVPNSDGFNLAHRQFLQANNMTDQQAALMALVHHGAEQSTVALESFYEQWCGDALVLDKWFAMQASAPAQSSLALVESLLEHPAFSIKNPNKVRSLLGAFGGNLTAFHHPSGRGYRLLANQILRLNELNPQVAARLVGIFNNWRVFDTPFKDQLKAELERIADNLNLSKDVAEIVSKALAS
ncbi:MAG: aminopeptidase N [Pseudomonadota bacterium]